MDIIYTDTMTGEEYNELRLSVDWKPLTSVQAERGLAHTAFVVAARDGEKIVGMGRMLFEHAARWARMDGAKKLYISSHSAQETQAFYAAMGCVDTLWPSPEHVALEPFDCQLEYTL